MIAREHMAAGRELSRADQGAPLRAEAKLPSLSVTERPGNALARLEFGSACPMKRRGVGSRSSCKITDLERHRAGNQELFNAFSTVIKCVFRVELAD